QLVACFSVERTKYLMLSKSMPERSEPQLGMGFLPNRRSALRRWFSIHSGSFSSAEMLRTTSSERPRCADMPAASLSCQPYSYAPIEAMISSSVCFSPVGWAVPAASWVGALMVVLPLSVVCGRGQSVLGVRGGSCGQGGEPPSGARLARRRTPPRPAVVVRGRPGRTRCGDRGGRAHGDVGRAGRGTGRGGRGRLQVRAEQPGEAVGLRLAQLGELLRDVLHRAVALAQLDRGGAGDGAHARRVAVVRERRGELLGAALDVV